MAYENTLYLLPAFLLDMEFRFSYILPTVSE